MSIAEVEDRAVPVITLLRNGGRATDAHDMARVVAQLKSSEKMEGALEGIIARSNMRWLGDIPLKNIGNTEWLQMLVALESAASAELVIARNRSSHRRKADYEKETRHTTHRAVNREKNSPWVNNTSTNTHNKWSKKETTTRRAQSHPASSRTHSASARNRGGMNPRWPNEGPISRAQTPFWARLLFFLPPFALIAYSVLVIIDSSPDLSPMPSVIVDGEVDRLEARDNYSPFADKGVLYLIGYDTGFGIQQALGYGFTDISNQLSPADSVSMRIDADAVLAKSSRVADIVDALENAQTEGDYDLIVSGIERGGTSSTVPILELNINDEIIYSRLQPTEAAIERIWSWGFLGLAAFIFLIVAARNRES